MTSGAAGAQDAANPGGAAPVEVGAKVDLPSAVPAFLEACGKLAGEAAASKDFAKAQEIIEKAARCLSPR